MLELRDRTKTIGSGKDADTIGIDALNFLAQEPELLQRFLDLSGLEIKQIRTEAKKSSFFVGLLDFILAHEPTVMEFAAVAGLDPAEVDIARQKLAER